jgi:hypothetical protein
MNKNISNKLKTINQKRVKAMSMTKTQINDKLEKLLGKHLKSMDGDQIWEITREILYLKIALGLLKKHKKSNLNELLDIALNYDGAFQFRIGNIYPTTVLLTAENYRSSVRLVQDFVNELSAYLNESEQMLFKIALCEEHFKPSED